MAVLATFALVQPFCAFLAGPAFFPGLTEVDATWRARLPALPFVVVILARQSRWPASFLVAPLSSISCCLLGGDCRTRCVAPVGANSKRNRSGSRAVRSRSRSTIGGRAHDGRRSRIDKTSGAGSRSRETSSRPTSGACHAGWSLVRVARDPAGTSQSRTWRAPNCSSPFGVWRENVVL